MRSMQTQTFSSHSASTADGVCGECASFSACFPYAAALAPPTSLRQPLELRLRIGRFHEILGAGAGGGPQRFDRGRSIGAQELPFADVELRLAALVRLGGR